MSAAVVTTMLAAARLWALLRVQASWRRALGPGWEPIAAALALLLSLLGLTTGDVQLIAITNPAALAAAVVFELVLGSVLGLLVSLPGWALLGASEEIAETFALGPDSSLARTLILASLAAAMALGLHRVAILAMLGSFTHWPLAQPLAWSAMTPASPIAPAVALSCLALTLASPLLMTRLLVAACTATLDHDPKHTIEPALRLAAGLSVLAAAWSSFPQVFATALG